MAIAYDPTVERLLKECEEGMDDQPKSEEKWHAGPEKIIVTEIAYVYRLLFLDTSLFDMKHWNGKPANPRPYLIIEE